MDKPAPSIHDLYPYYTNEELAQAEDNLDRYLAIVLQIFDRLEMEAEADQLTPVSGAVNCKEANEDHQQQQPQG